MSTPDLDRSPLCRLLSALADGDATEAEAARVFAGWREDAQARAAWHSYHLIGDVLRSEELAAEPAANERFLQALRARLAEEPVVLAPVEPAVAAPVEAAAAAAVANAGRGRGSWQGPAVAVAGFAAVLVGINLARTPAGGAGNAVVASTAPAPTVVAAAAPVAPAVLPVAASAAMVADAGSTTTPAAAARADAELAPYLAAHRQSTMNAAFQMPAGDLRNVSFVQTAP